MRPAFDYSKKIRRKLAEGMTLDAALAELRTEGASIFDCIVSVRTFRGCDIADAKRIIEASPVWSDHHSISEDIEREFGNSN